MKTIATIVAILVTVLLTAGCGTPTYLERRTSELQPLLASGNEKAIVEGFFREFTYEDSDSTELRRRLSGRHGIREPLKARIAVEYQSAIGDSTPATPLRKANTAVRLARSSGLIEEADVSLIRAEAVSTVRRLMSLGTATLDLTDDGVIHEACGQRFPDIWDWLFRNTIARLDSGASLYSSADNVSALVDYLKGPLASQQNLATFLQSLPKWKLSTRDVKTLESANSSWAQAYVGARQKNLILKTDPPDRLLLEDVKAALKARVDFLQFVTTTDPKVVTLTVGKLQSELRETPERRETITYAQHEVNLAAAVLLMPRNASYTYEVSSGGMELSAAYLIKLERDGRVITDRVFRDQLTESYNSCHSARIVNVFGGATSADFLANQDMQNRCSGNNSRPTASGMQSKMNDRFVGELVKELEKN